MKRTSIEKISDFWYPDPDPQLTAFLFCFVVVVVVYIIEEKQKKKNQKKKKKRLLIKKKSKSPVYFRNCTPAHKIIFTVNIWKQSTGTETTNGF